MEHDPGLRKRLVAGAYREYSVWMGPLVSAARRVTGGDAGYSSMALIRWNCSVSSSRTAMSIGRAFGGGACVLSRTEEPILFRRCHLWSLDWWGDAAGAYVRIEELNHPGPAGLYSRTASWSVRSVR